MSIPVSGPLSMSMFNTEMGRASNTADSSLAGGSTPSVGSLFWLANQSGSLNQTAPHAMSEWYGYTTMPVYSFYAYVDATGFAGVCNTTLSILIYTSYSGATFSVGQYYYTNSSLTTPLGYGFASTDAATGYTINTSTGQATTSQAICG
jgi:hypothetical protein